MINGLTEGSLPSAFLLCFNKDSKDWLLGHMDYNGTYLACSIYRMPASLCIRKVEAKAIRTN